MNILEAYLANSLDLLKFFGVLGYLSAYTVGAAASALYDLAAKNDQDKKEIEESETDLDSLTRLEDVEEMDEETDVQREKAPPLGDLDLGSMQGAIDLVNKAAVENQHIGQVGKLKIRRKGTMTYCYPMTYFS